MSWLDRALSGLMPARSDMPLSFDEWASYFTFQGLQYPFTTYGGSAPSDTEGISNDFQGVVQGAYKANGIIFACMLARMMLFSEARFQFRRVQSGRPGELFGTDALLPLERPWMNATTGDLLTRAIQDVDLAGNFFAHRPGRMVAPSGRVVSGSSTIRRLRPDWVTIVVGSQTQADDPAHAIDAEVAGYVYQPGGPMSENDPVFLAPESVAHFAPIPDPTANFRGMSWITPIIREVMGDNAATTHKLRFFENGATPNMVVTAQPAVKTVEQFDNWVEKMKQSVDGLRNAYKTLYLGNGSTAEVVGADMRQVDFKATQGAGETRIAAAAGVPPIIAGFSEGLASATYSNYGQARRRFADGTVRPLWRNFAGSMATIIDLPRPDRQGAVELWYDDRDIPFLQEDVKDAAEAQQVNAITVKQLIEAGFDPATVVEAVNAGDFKRLKHTGLVSVQLQVPGTTTEAPTAAPVANETPDDKAGRALRALAEGR